MPKDKIEDATGDGWYAEVSWRRKPDGDDRGSAQGHVQMATVNLHSPFEFPDVESEGHFEAGERFDGWRVTLDEPALDRLIRTLHRAKRQAFGPPMQPTARPDIVTVAPPKFANGGLITSGGKDSVPVQIDPSEHFMRDISTIEGYPQWRCVRPEHRDAPCSVTGDTRPDAPPAA